MSIHSALVIGGGIAGPVCAAALRRAGIHATVYEAYPQASNGIGNALALSPNGVAALEIVGAADAVRRIALPITSTRMSVGHRDLGALPALAGAEPLQMVDRGELHTVLRTAAEAAGVRFEYGKRLVRAQQDSGGITASFADGSSATADLLIGADGVRSTVRTLIDPDAPAAGYTGLLGFGAAVDAGLDLEPGVMTFAFGARAYYLYWGLPDGRTAWGANLPRPQYFSLTQARAVPRSQWVSEIRATYAGDHPGEQLARATDEQNLEVLGAIHIMPPVPHWSRGRMVLVGDAVHAPSNSTGQGASLAIESAIELARCLRDLPVPDALAAYEGLRRARVEKITRRGARTNHAKTPGPVGRALMSTLMPLAFRLMNAEEIFGWEQRFRIDWDAPVQPVPIQAEKLHI